MLSKGKVKTFIVSKRKKMKEKSKSKND